MSVPANSEAITPNWLTAVLHEAGALDQARVTSIESAPIGQLGFTGQIWRLQIGYDKPELWNTVIKTYPNVSQFWTYGK